MSSRDLVEKHNVHLEGKEHGRDRHLCNSASVRLQNGPDVVKVLKDNLLRPSKQSQSQGSFCVLAAIPEQRAKRDVTTFDE